MDKKQGFFSAVARGLSPSRARSRLSCPPVARRGNLAPLMEGPDSGEDPIREKSWFCVPREQDDCGSDHRRSVLRMMMGVMGTPLAPVHVSYGEPLPHLSIKNTPFETSCAQYILQQYIAASGGLKPLNSIKNSYVMGKVKMVVLESETATKVVKNRHVSRAGESGGFVLWQMAPEMWYVELAVCGSKVSAGCDGKIIWRQTPWLGAHAAKGPVRPLRRPLQGLDPLTTASMFANARCIGEKNVNGEDCFILKIFSDPETLNSTSEGPAEITRHDLFGYFSQRTGLLLLIEDSHLTRIHSNSCGETIYWETTTDSFLEDYRPVNGVMIAHSGRSIVTLFRFGEVAMSRRKNTMEEIWTIEEMAFNVHGLSLDCFIPPSDLKCGSVSEAVELTRVEKGKAMAKVAAI